MSKALLIHTILVFVNMVSSRSDAASSYAVTDLGSLGISGSVSDVNNLGQVVGYYTPEGGVWRAFLYSEGRRTDVGSFGNNTVSYARSINDAGEIVGYSAKAGGSGPTAFLYRNGTITNLPTLGGLAAEAQAINNNGQIVGSSRPSNNSNSHAFLYSNGEMSDLGAVFGGNSWATDINDRSQIVGGFKSINDAKDHAFLFTDGRMLDIGNQSFDHNQVSGINEQGQVVGYSYLLDAATNSFITVARAFVYSNGHMTEISGFGDARSFANDINNLGQVVGVTDTVDIDTTIVSRSHVFLYSDGRIVDLNILISPDSGWNLLDAIAINDKGQIVGLGSNGLGYQHALLLTPVPIPAAIWFLYSGLALLSLISRGRTSQVPFAQN